MLLIISNDIGSSEAWQGWWEISLHLELGVEFSLSHWCLLDGCCVCLTRKGKGSGEELEVLWGTLERESSSPRPPSLLFHQRAQTQLETAELREVFKIHDSHRIPLPPHLPAASQAFLIPSEASPSCRPVSCSPRRDATAPATPTALQPRPTLFLLS